MDKPTPICKRCGKPAIRGILLSEGECIRCFNESLPPCQYPGCTNKCSRKGYLLCDSHFFMLTHNGMTEETAQKFVKKFAEIGIRINIFQSGE